MITAMAIAQPQDIQRFATDIGYVSLGVMISFVIALIYSLSYLKRSDSEEPSVIFRASKYLNITESVIFGTTVGVSLLIAKLFQMSNPYWIPVSCMAVMQGISTQHVVARAIQRVLGTVVGLGLMWCILQIKLSVLGVCLCILIHKLLLNFLWYEIMLLLPFLLPCLPYFWQSSNIFLLVSHKDLFQARLLDTLIGSAIGAAGGGCLPRIHFFIPNYR